MLNRRSFLRGLALTAGGLYVPKVAYSFASVLRSRNHLAMPLDEFVAQYVKPTTERYLQRWDVSFGYGPAFPNGISCRIVNISADSAGSGSSFSGAEARDLGEKSNMDATGTRDGTGPVIRNC